MKKFLSIAKRIVVYLIVAVAVFMMIFTVVSVATFDNKDRSIFGYKAFIVLSDSMKATDFAAGDLVLSKAVKDPSTLQPGDIITFQSTNPDSSYGSFVTHKIRELTTAEDGRPGFITYGTTEDTNDKSVVTYDFVIGKYQTHIPGVGKFFQFLKTTPGYIVCILLPFLVLILLQGINSVKLFLRYRQEQMAELDAEKEKIEAERQASQEMMRELLELKAKLNAQGALEARPQTQPAEPGPEAEADPGIDDEPDDEIDEPDDEIDEIDDIDDEIDEESEEETVSYDMGDED